jgi:CHAT domain-containing protein
MGDVQAHVGPCATKAVLARDGRKARIVHVAAHAQHHPDDPMLSGLLLGDGWLTAHEVYELSIAPEVLVLSGCATGRVGVTEGDDLFGLVRGFLHAGAPSIVASLWKVSDDVTLRFMESFHSVLEATGSPGTAVRAAALSVRSAFPHPRDWAPFVCIGRGSPPVRSS